MATEASASASVAVTAANVRGPKPEPPTSTGSSSPSSPDSPSDSIASVENRPALSFCAADDANTRLAISVAFKTAASCIMVAPVIHQSNESNRNCLLNAEGQNQRDLNQASLGIHVLVDRT